MIALKESTGVDLVVAPTPLTDQDRQLISEAITAYKTTRKPRKRGTGVNAAIKQIVLAGKTGS